MQWHHFYVQSRTAGLMEVERRTVVSGGRENGDGERDGKRLVDCG